MIFKFQKIWWPLNVAITGFNLLIKILTHNKYLFIYILIIFLLVFEKHKNLSFFQFFISYNYYFTQIMISQGIGIHWVILRSSTDKQTLKEYFLDLFIYIYIHSVIDLI